MKKILFLTIIATLLFTGCSGNKTPNPEEVRKMTLNQERRIGILQSLGGAFTSSQATHLLRMDDGKTLALKSSLVDLKSEKYSGKEVEVMGEILRTTDGNQVMTVDSIDIIDTEGAIDDQLPQWLDYNSENLNLSFKYRDDYQVEEHDGILITKIPQPEEDTDAESVQLSTPAPAEDKPLTEIAMNKISSDKEGLISAMGIQSLDSSDVLAGGYNRSKITQRAIEAYKKSELGGRKIVYFFQVGEAGYKVSFNADEEEQNLVEEQNMFYDILASVDFSGDYEAPEVNDESESGQTEQESPEEDSSTVEEDTTEETSEPGQEEDGDIASVSSDSNISGFETFKSESQNFTIQYPKSYYFGSTSPASADAIRSYQFGSSPLEESPGEITLDIISGGMPDGKTTEYGGVSMVRATTTSGVELYFEKSGKVYRLSGDKSDEGLLKQMASTLQ